MEVHHATQLVLRDLRILHGRYLGHLSGRDAEGPGHQATQGDGEPPPQVRCPPLPHQVRGVVVAVRTQRLPEQRVLVVVSLVAAAWASVRTDSTTVSLSTAASVISAVAVHETEGRCGNGGEHQRVLRHRRRDGLAAADSGPDQLEHVRRIQPRTRRARGCPAVPAPHMRDLERLLAAGIARQDLAGDPVDGLGAADQPDRVGTVPDTGQRLGPGIEPGRGEQFRDLPRNPVVQEREVERRAFATAREGVREEDRQGGGHVRPSPRGHRPHHPEKGVPHGQFAIRRAAHPVQGVRDHQLKNGSRRRDRCNAETRPDRVVQRTNEISESLCLQRLSVCGLWPEWGADPPGKFPVVRV